MTVKKDGLNQKKSAIYSAYVSKLRQIVHSIPKIIILFLLLFPHVSQSQDWQFSIDSLRDDGPIVPMLINPLIDGIVPEKYYSDNIPEGNSKNYYNGYRVQVLSTKIGEEAEEMRLRLFSQINHVVQVIFDAPNYKVRVGAFQDRKDAQRLLGQLDSLGYRKAWIVRARISF